MHEHPVKIARLFHWEMGHRLPFHDGGCANIHGHSYRMWVEVEGICDENGMLIDYGDLKKAIQPIIDPLDHAFLCAESDVTMREFLEAQRFKFVLVPFHSTAENISAYLVENIWSVLEPFSRITGVSIKLHETDNSYSLAGKSRPPA